MTPLPEETKRRLKRIWRFWSRVVKLRDEWPYDKLTLVWVWLPVETCVLGRHVEPTGQRKRGFVVRRDGIYLTGPIHHDLRWYRYWHKHLRQPCQRKSNLLLSQT